MDNNFTDFTKNVTVSDTFDTWTSSGDISSSTDVAMPRRVAPASKRPHAKYNEEPPAKRAAPSIRVGAGFKWNLQTLANAADAVESGGKSPVSALNELGVRVAYCVLHQGGPAHCPSFHVAVTLELFKKSVISVTDVNVDVKARVMSDTVNMIEQKVGAKHPICVVNEMGLPYYFTHVCKTGAEHTPMFLARLAVADMTFEGWGHSKREARAAAARACLGALLARAGRVLPAPDPHQDFTSDEPQQTPVSEFQCLESRVKLQFPLSPAPLQAPQSVPATAQSPQPAPEPLQAPQPTPELLQSPEPVLAQPKSPLPQPQLARPTIGNKGRRARAPASADKSPAAALFGAAAPRAPDKSPINVLYENYAGLAFTCTFGDGSTLTEGPAPMQLSHSMRFKVVCQIKGQKFEGYGSSKKLAKLAAARSALAALEENREASPPPEESAPPPDAAAPDAPPRSPDALFRVPAVPPRRASGPRAAFGPMPVHSTALRQTLADHISKLVNEKFNELMKNDLMHAKRKVLAGIVMTTNSRVQDARVIAVTTGTKCVSGEHMSVSGRGLNDCHAEVAARRCLQRHLYAQLLMYANQSDPRRTIPESDVEPAPGGGYQLKPSRQVHMFVSTAPCGDGRIFSPHEHHASAEPDKHPNRLARGQLRTKIESGEGTIPVKNCTNVVQTWDGVMQGERLLTMSCSDKVARWSVCGLQGALLSCLLRPVYLHSLVLGSLLNPEHMYRAICGRIEPYISSLPPPFRLHPPRLARAASVEARTPARAPSFSVCWCATMQAPEVVNATTGKLDSGTPSLLCKQSMFARWQYLVKRLPLLPQEADPANKPPAVPDNLDGLLYNGAKQMCPSYQLAKKRLIDAFEQAKLGRWIKRPMEQDQFVCEIKDADPALLFA